MIKDNNIKNFLADTGNYKLPHGLSCTLHYVVVFSLSYLSRISSIIECQCYRNP